MQQPEILVNSRVFGLNVSQDQYFENLEKEALLYLFASLDRKGKLKLNSESVQQFKGTFQSTGDFSTLIEQYNYENSKHESETESGLGKLVKRFHLNGDQRKVLILLWAVHCSPTFLRTLSLELNETDEQKSNLFLYEIMEILGTTQTQQLELCRLFKPTSTLVSKQLIHIEEGHGHRTGFLSHRVSLPISIQGEICGLDLSDLEAQETIDIVEPKFNMDEVVLPKTNMDKVEAIINSYAAFEKGESKQPLLKGYGTGVSLLFYGPPGTGKTMLAHGIAKKLGKKLATPGAMQGRFHRRYEMVEQLKVLFREAQLNNMVVFIDEFDDLFYENSEESRALLIELEKSNCISIFASNKIEDLDPGLDRRFTLKLQFEIPNEEARRRIWESHLPDEIRSRKNIDFTMLSHKFQLGGGHIRNAVQIALLRDIHGQSTNLQFQELLLDSARSQANSIGCQVVPERTYQIEANPNNKFFTKKTTETLENLARYLADLNMDEAQPIIAVTGCSEETISYFVQHLSYQSKLGVREITLNEAVEFESVNSEFRHPTSHRKISLWQYLLRKDEVSSSFCFLKDKESALLKCLGCNPDADTLSNFGIDKIINALSLREIPVIIWSPASANAKLIRHFDVNLEISKPSIPKQAKYWLSQLPNLTENQAYAISERYSSYPDEIAEKSRRVQIATKVLGGSSYETLVNIFKSEKKDVLSLFGSYAKAES